MRRILATALAAALALCLFAGCTGGTKYVDGVYRAEDAEYNYGYKEFVEITVSGGKISKVQANAVKEDGITLKTADVEYIKGYENTGNDTTPDVFFPSLAKQLEKTKNVDKVEVVAGATNSSGNFKRLATAALANAADGKTEVAMLKSETAAQ